MTVVGLVPHPQRAAAREAVVRLAGSLSERGVDIRIPEPDAGATGLGRFGVAPGDFADGLDFAVSLGGDGTMLRTVDLVYGEGVPVLGVNLGQMGFLTEVEPEEIDSALERILAGDHGIEERMVVRVSVTSDGSAAGEWWALNECVLEKDQPGRLARLAVTISGKFFTTYAADGMIVATPTGSTAYAFSARGPIISPALRCLLLTPVSPHMLFDRSLVLAPDEELRIEVLDSTPVDLILDGRTLGALGSGDVVVCTEGEHPARLIVFRRRDFHQTLKAKFGLADR